jgi:hypothetical protein
MEILREDKTAWKRNGGRKGGECDEVSFLLGEKVDRAISYIALHGRGDRR